MTNAVLRSPEEIKQIDSLIPAASKLADARVLTFGKETEPRSGVDGKEVNWDFWTQFFHEEMLRLRYVVGLQ